MTEFKGFPDRMQFTPVPNVIFSSLFPQITDIVELKILLYVLAIIYPKKGNIRFCSLQEILNLSGLGEGIRIEMQNLPETVRRTLTNLTVKGALLNLSVNQEQTAKDLYFLNTEANRVIIEKIRSGEIVLPGIDRVQPVQVSSAAIPDIFTLYEENIGMLTPLIADELKEAQKHYPENWIKEAIKEAADLNKHNWKYIARILERWSTEGKNDGTNRGHLKKNNDPDKYIRGKYGHMVQR